MANLITALRIICSITLLFCPTFSKEFYVLYLMCGISDFLDGFIARKLNKETKFGARFDTISDFIFFLVVLIKVIRKVFMPLWLIIWTILIGIIKCISFIKGIKISGHLITEHTLLNKICGIILFVIPLLIKIVPLNIFYILLVLVAVMATVASLQETKYILKGIEVN